MYLPSERKEEVVSVIQQAILAENLNKLPLSKNNSDTTHARKKKKEEKLKSCGKRSEIEISEMEFVHKVRNKEERE